LRLRPLVFVSLGIFAWALALIPFGLVPATAALIAISALATRPFRPVSTAALCVALSAAGYLVFIWGLGMPLTLFGR
jgi:hypothetical protein